MSDDDRKRLRSNMNLAEKLGARLDTVTGDDVPYQIAEYARVSDVSTIVIGQTNTVGGLLRRKKSLTDRLVAYAPDLDYFIIPDYGTKIYVARKQPERKALQDHCRMSAKKSPPQELKLSQSFPTAKMYRWHRNI
jgi:two-component system sensor histidine kinase KdpD